MSSKGYATPLRLESAAVPPLQQLYLLFVGLVLIVLASTPLPYGLQLPLLLSCVLLAWRVWHRRSELGAGPVSLVWDAEQRWWWHQGGREVELQLRGDSYLSARLIVLNFREAGSARRYSLVLLPRSLGEETFRRLRVRLRLEQELQTTS